MQTIKQLIANGMDGIDINALVNDALFEGMVKRANDNTIGIEIEMAHDMKPSAINDNQTMQMIDKVLETMEKLVIELQNELHDSEQLNANAVKSIAQQMKTKVTQPLVELPSNATDLITQRTNYLQLASARKATVVEPNERNAHQLNGSANQFLKEMQKLQDSDEFSQLFPDEALQQNAPYVQFREKFSAIGWRTVKDRSIKPYGLEATSGIINLNDLHSIEMGFTVAKDLHQIGWKFNESTGIHFHLGQHNDASFFYIVAMIVQMYEKQSYIYSHFPTRKGNRFAKDVRALVIAISNAIYYWILNRPEETGRIQLTDKHQMLLLRELPASDEERYFGVNAIPSLIRHGQDGNHGTIEMRYFAGEPFMKNPQLLHSIVSMFKDVIHDAQTKRFVIIPAISGNPRIIIERLNNEVVFASIPSSSTALSKMQSRLQRQPGYLNADDLMDIAAHEPNVFNKEKDAQQKAKDKVAINIGNALKLAMEKKGKKK